MRGRILESWSPLMAAELKTVIAATTGPASGRSLPRHSPYRGSPNTTVLFLFQSAINPPQVQGNSAQTAGAGSRSKSSAACQVETAPFGGDASATPPGSPFKTGQSEVFLNGNCSSHFATSARQDFIRMRPAAANL